MSTISTNATLALSRSHAAALPAGTALRVTDASPAHAGEACTLLNLPSWARSNTAATTEDDSPSTVLDTDNEMLVEFANGNTGYVSIERLTLAGEQEQEVTPPEFTQDAFLEEHLDTTPIAAANAIRRHVYGITNDLDNERRLLASSRNEVESIRETVRSLIEQRDAAQQQRADAVNHLERVRLSLISEGERRDWCSELDDFLARNDLEGRERTEQITVEVRLNITRTITLEVSYTGGDSEREDAVIAATEDLDADTLAGEFNQWGDYASIDGVDEVR
jgi:hypothetical protein